MFLRILPERRGGARDPEQRGNRQQQAQSQIGQGFDFREHFHRYFADTRDILFRNLFIHASPRFRPAYRRTKAGAKRFRLFELYRFK